MKTFWMLRRLSRWVHSGRARSGSLVSPDHLLGMLARGFGQLRSGEHPGHLFCTLLAPGSPTVLEFFGQINAQMTQFAPLLTLAVPNKTLVNAYQEMMAAAG